MAFVDISYPNTNISTIFDFTRPVDECSEIAFSARQIAQNIHCDKHQILVHKLNFSSLGLLMNVISGGIRV